MESNTNDNLTHLLSKRTHLIVGPLHKPTPTKKKALKILGNRTLTIYKMKPRCKIKTKIKGIFICSEFHND